MSDQIPSALLDLVQSRSRHRCEYCLLHESDAKLGHEVDHIIARKHRGQTVESNLAWACFACNHHKGSDIASIDIENGQLVPLFNPRTDVWTAHFRLEGARVIPLTAEGRVTEYLLQFNQPKRLRIRKLLLTAGRYPR
jgi:hypothetical protein